jgi:hypothetical protein
MAGRTLHPPITSYLPLDGAAIGTGKASRQFVTHLHVNWRVTIFACEDIPVWLVVVGPVHAVINTYIHTAGIAETNQQLASSQLFNTTAGTILNTYPRIQRQTNGGQSVTAASQPASHSLTLITTHCLTLIITTHCQSLYVV